MAATPFDAPLPESSFVFDIYTDGAAAARSAPSLPGGPCNYVDLTPGAVGTKCGCRRFWTRQGVVGYPATASTDQTGWCMCSHHACFHDDIQGVPGPTQPAAVGITAGQENERPVGNREPLSPVQHLASFQMPSNLDLSFDLGCLPTDASLGAIDADLLAAAVNEPQAEVAATGPESSMPDTLSWSNFVQTDGHTAIAPSTPRCLPPSQPPSTTASSQARYMRPFSGRGLQTLSGVSHHRPLQERSATAGSGSGAVVAAAAEARMLGDILSGSRATTPKAQVTRELTAASQQQVSPPPGVSQEAFQQLSDTVQGHEHRLDKLESASFPAADHDECHDRHEGVDLRVTDLESRVEEVEKRLNDDSSSTIASSRRSARDDDATISVVSVASDATTRARDRSEMYSQLQALQAQVNSLQGVSLPTYNKPWELEVVFLPFPLKGVWMESNEFATQRPSGLPGANDEWTQLPNTLSRQTPDPRSPRLDWADRTPDVRWLSPRACAPGRLIDQRLKSRGLVKTISVKGADARSVHLAVAAAFDPVLRAMPVWTGSAIRRSSQPDTRFAGFLGLQQAWVPLRKIHKDSRLRFLTPAEMVTPALWDADFFLSSVVMKATGTHRLYVTQPEAYVQDARSRESGWSWQRLRELSRVYPDSQSSNSTQEVPEADAAEGCWGWNERLDDAPTPISSAMSARQAAQPPNRSHSSGSSQLFFTGAQSPVLTTSPVVLRAQSPLIAREKKGARPPHLRTTSMPPAMPAIPSPSGSTRRRVVSHAMVTPVTAIERRSSPFVGSSRPSPRVSVMTSPAIGAAISKRQGTRSPSLRPRTTPRWSLSRSPSLAPFLGGDDRVRATTPFYYATPYSNAAFEHQRHGSRGPMPATGYDDEEMDCGSGTDPYDDRGKGGDANEEDDDDDFDIEVYEDEADEMDDDTEDTDAEGRHESQPWRVIDQQQQQMAQAAQLPEDEPWPGIEDHMSDGENLDPRSVEDGHEGLSQRSSQPSEYPSTQRAWHISSDADGAQQEGDGGAEFRIHEDQDVGAGGPATQWA